MSVPRTAQLPIGVKPLRLSTERGAFATLRAGTTGSVVVLVPGFTGSKEDFTPLLPLLADAGFAVIAYDQAGQFESPPPRGEYTLTDWADDLLAVCDAASEGNAVHVVGHSFGGLVAREAVIAQPRGFTSIALLDSGPGALPRDHHDRLRLLCEIAPSHSMAQIYELKEMLEQQDGVPQVEPAVAEFLKRRWLAGSAAALADMAMALIDAPDRTDALAATGVPALVAFGAHDLTAWPLADQRAMAARLSCAAIEIPDAEHSPQTENPAATAAALLPLLTSDRYR